MSLQPNRSIIIVGTGPGMSRSLSIYLASQDWSIVLISRTESSLQKYADELKSLHPSVKVYTRPADASDPVSLSKALDWAAGQLHGEVDVLCYNAATVAQSDLMVVTADELKSSWATSALGTLTAGQWFAKNANTKRLSDGEYPLFIIPGGKLNTNPMPVYASLSSAKSASQNLVLQFSECLPQEYHVLVAAPIVTNVIAPGTNWDPDVIVDKIFRPFLIAREKFDGDLSAWEHIREW